MGLPEFFDFCKSAGPAGVLLVALAVFAWWASPIRDALIAFITHTADLKPQLDEIAEAQKTQAKTAVCRFEAPSTANPAPAQVGSH